MAKTKHLQVKGLSRRKGSKDYAPIQNKVLMGFLAIFLVLSLLLTIQPVAEAVGKATGIDPGQLRKWGNRLASFGGGILMISVAGSLAGAPIIAGALVVAGLILIGWAAYATYAEMSGRGDVNTPID